MDLLINNRLQQRNYKSIQPLRVKISDSLPVNLFKKDLKNNNNCNIK